MHMRVVTRKKRENYVKHTYNIMKDNLIYLCEWRLYLQVDMKSHVLSLLL